MQRTRSLGGIALAALALLVAGCDDDDDMDAGVDAGVDSGPAPDAGPPDTGVGVEAPPVITRVSWEAEPECESFIPSDVDITVTVVDPDTPASMLTFSGTAVGCTGAIESASATVDCPNAAPYPSSVTVTDPQGHEDTVSFTFGPCETGMAEF